MRRIDDPSASPTLPPPEAAGIEGYFTEGNPGVTPATLVRASFLNLVQEELRAIVVAGGLAPSKTTYNQVLLAIKALMQQSSGVYALDAGAVNVHQVTYAPAVTAIVDGMTLKFRAKFANTGAATFSPNGLPAAPIWGGDHAAVGGGEIVANGAVWLQWSSVLNGGNGAWLLIDSTGGYLKTPTPPPSDNSTKLATTAWAKFGLSYSFGASGYVAFPAWLGGLVFQWIAPAVTAQTLAATTFVTAAAVNWPITFPTACRWAIGGPNISQSVAGVLSYSATQVTAVLGNLAIGSSQTVGATIFGIGN